MKKVLAVTGIRSDYDLMSGLYKLMSKDPEIDLKLVVGGAHLSPAYGYSVKNIEADGIDILLKVESLINSDSVSSRLKSASIFLQGIIDAVANWNPDLIVYAGDREEVLIGAMLGSYLEIPTIHFYGGDHTKTGHVDNPVRHAVAKLSTAHFVMTEEHKKRILALGEKSERIHVVGNLSLDNFVQQKPMDKDQVFKSLGVAPQNKDYALVIYHPDNIERDNAGEVFESILKKVKEKGLFAFVSYPNIDLANQKIVDKINAYQNDPNFCFYKNLDRDLFISLYKHAKIIVGNSSSGILESASIPLPSVSVGIRQVGRAAGSNVVFCNSEPVSIAKALDQALSPAFETHFKNIKNPYGDGTSCARSLKLIKETDFKKMMLKVEDPLEER